MEKITYENEIWKPAVGWEGFYEVSNKGRVRSLPRVIKNDIVHKDGTRVHQEYMKEGTILKPQNNGRGYYDVGLHAPGKKDKHVYIHILVAKAFIPNPQDLPQVNHKNFDKSDNSVENLEWVSDMENKLHYRRSRRCHIAEEKKKQHLVSKTLQRVKDNKDAIIKAYLEGNNVKETARIAGVGKDFASDVLYLFGYMN